MTLTRKQIADAIDGYDAEIAVLQESKRETYAGYREQLAEVMGRDAVKAEIEGVKAAIKRRQAVVKKGETAVEERDALIDEIFAEITASRAPRATRVEPIEEFDAETGEILDTESRPADAPVATEAGRPSGDEARQQFEPLPLDPAAQEVGVVSTAQLSSSGRTESSADGQTVLVQEGGVEGEGQAGATREHSSGEPSQPLLPSDRVDETPDAPAVIAGVPNSPETATQSAGSAVAAVTGANAQLADAAGVEPLPAETVSPMTRGAIAYEKTPPRPVSRHAFNRCWPDRWGMSLEIFADDVREHGVRNPIVKIGDEILDGWYRYTVARDLGIEYPVVQYHGDDPLADSIRMNLEAGGRLLTLNEQKQIAAKFAKVPGNEHRASEILELFGFKAEEAAA